MEFSSSTNELLSAFLNFPPARFYEETHTPGLLSSLHFLFYLLNRESNMKRVVAIIGSLGTVSEARGIYQRKRGGGENGSVA